MNSLATAVSLSLLLAAAAGAQQPSDAPPELPQAAPTAKRNAAYNPYWQFDPAMKELTQEAGAGFGECLQGLDYLKADLASSKRRIRESNGGQIPGSQGSLLALKMKNIERQEQNCVAMTKEIGTHFDIVMRFLANVEPRNHPGIPARKEKLAALRAKFNASVKKLRAEGIGKNGASAGPADAEAEQ